MEQRCHCSHYLERIRDAEKRPFASHVHETLPQGSWSCATHWRRLHARPAGWMGELSSLARHGQVSSIKRGLLIFAALAAAFVAGTSAHHSSQMTISWIVNNQVVHSLRVFTGSDFEGGLAFAGLVATALLPACACAKARQS